MAAIARACSPSSKQLASMSPRLRPNCKKKVRHRSSSPGLSSCSALPIKARHWPTLERERLSQRVHELAGKPAPAAVLVDVPRLITAYYTQRPDPSVAAQRVAFGTSGHRGSSFDASFNEDHVLAITQAICRYRSRQG